MQPLQERSQFVTYLLNIFRVLKLQLERSKRTFQRRFHAKSSVTVDAVTHCFSASFSEAARFFQIVFDGFLAPEKNIRNHPFTPSCTTAPPWVTTAALRISSSRSSASAPSLIIRPTKATRFLA